MADNDGSADAMMTDEIAGANSGTKRVNKKAAGIAFAVIGMVLAFVIYQLFNMGDFGEPRRDAAPQVIDSLDRAREITGNIRIPGMPEPPETPLVIIPEAKPEAAPPPVQAVRTPPAPRPPLMAAASKPEGPDPLTLELMRLEAVRQKQYEAAITGAVMVRLDQQGARNSNPYTPPGSSGNAVRSRREVLAAVDAEIARNNAILAQYAGGDANAVYQRQMAAMQTGNAAVGEMRDGGSGVQYASMPGGGIVAGGDVLRSGGGGPGGRGNSLTDFDGDASRWVLASEMDDPSQFMIRAGSVIPAVLLSGIISDLPGQILAQVSQNVYDTPTGRYLLIPQGTRLIGGYSSEVQYGQNRVFVAWQRLIFPDGRAYDLGSQPGTTGAGYAGLRDRVNHHLLRVFGSALLMSAVVGGISYSQDRGNADAGGDSDSNRGMSTAMSEALGQQMGQVTMEMIRRNMNIAPTIEIRPGFRLNVMLVKDVAFRKAYRAFDYRYASR